MRLCSAFRGKFFREAVEFRNGEPVDVDGVRGGKLGHSNADRILPVELQVVAVAFCA